MLLDYAEDLLILARRLMKSSLNHLYNPWTVQEAHLEAVSNLRQGCSLMTEG